MLKRKVTYVSTFGLLLLFLLMLVSPTEVFIGAKNGLLLWFQTILPTLLPFVIMSNVMIKTNTLYYISKIFGPVLKPFFQTTSAGVFVIIIGFLCGYPLGAKVIGQLYDNNGLNQEEAEYLLSFCNNVSPIFLINYLVIHSFHRVELIFPVLFIMIGSPVLCSFLFRIGKVCTTNTRISSLSNSPLSIRRPTPFTLHLFNQCMMDGFEMMVYLGGYMMTFSILVTLLHNDTFTWFTPWILPFLEVTNGISYIQTLPLTFEQQLVFSLAITSFGGICAILQTQMVLAKTNLSIRVYTIKKLVTMLVTSLLTVLYLLFI